MGFTTGFTGGVTLTLGIAYLTVLTHEKNRQAQAQLLRSQSRLLNSLLEPAELPPPQTRSELAREERSTLVETAKDRWNEEVENAVRWVQRTDWGEVREGMEGAVSRLLGSGLQKSREGIEAAEEKAGPKVQEAIDRSKAAARRSADQAATGVDQAVASTIAGVDKTGAEVKRSASKIADAAKIKADSAVASTKTRMDQASMKPSEYEDAAKVKAKQVAADTKSGAQDVANAIKSSGGTVDAARGAVRDAISATVEKGREVIGKAQAAVGLVSDKMESKAQAASLSNSSSVEAALKERYENQSGLNKKVEDALAERYEPIDSKTV